MLFDTIKEYDDELKDIEKRLNNMEKRFEKHPERIWIKGNHDSLKIIHDIILKERNELFKVNGGECKSMHK